MRYTKRDFLLDLEGLLVQIEEIIALQNEAHEKYKGKIDKWNISLSSAWIWAEKSVPYQISKGRVVKINDVLMTIRDDIHTHLYNIFNDQGYRRCLTKEDEKRYLDALVSYIVSNVKIYSYLINSDILTIDSTDLSSQIKTTYDKLQSGGD